MKTARSQPKCQFRVSCRTLSHACRTSVQGHAGAMFVSCRSTLYKCDMRHRRLLLGSLLRRLGIELPPESLGGVFIDAGQVLDLAERIYSPAQLDNLFGADVL